MRQQILFKLHLYEKILFQVKNSSMYSLYIKVWVLLYAHMLDSDGKRQISHGWKWVYIASMKYLPWSQILYWKILVYSKIVTVRFHFMDHLYKDACHFEWINTHHLPTTFWFFLFSICLTWNERTCKKYSKCKCLAISKLWDMSVFHYFSSSKNYYAKCYPNDIEFF